MKHSGRDYRPFIYLICIEIMKLMFIITWFQDPSLLIVRNMGNVPYGILWVILNPLYGLNDYPISLLISDFLPTLINFKYLSRRIFYLHQLTELYFFMGRYQNVSVIWF